MDHTFIWIDTAMQHAERFPHMTYAYEGPGLYNKRSGYQMDQCQRIDVCAPQVIRDGLPDIKSMADGRRYDSKRAYYRSVKRANCEIVDGLKPESYVAKPESDKAHMQHIVSDIKKSLEQLRSQ